MYCIHCGRPMSATARFCGGCGAPTTRHELSRGRALRQTLLEHSRRARVLAVVFLGTLAAVVLTSVAFAFSEAHGAAPLFLQSGLLVLVGLWGVRLLGEGALRDSLGGVPRARSFLLGLVGGGAMFAVSVLYVRVLALATPEMPDIQLGLDVWLVLQIVVAAPLLEEWLCRGVLWRACREITTEHNAIALTALVFAMLHGLNGGYLLELPHRFVGGLILGVLRARTQSLIPCICAHFVNNALAVWLEV